MRLDLALFYGGPDQLMPLTSGLAAAFALLLIFWNKVLGIVVAIQNRLRRTVPAVPKQKS